MNNGPSHTHVGPECLQNLKMLDIEHERNRNWNSFYKQKTRGKKTGGLDRM